MSDIDLDQEYADFCPCIYMGKIKCVDCDRYKYCDMKEGREHRAKAFKAGWDAAIRYMAAGFTKSFEEDITCKSNLDSICMCIFGKNGCLNTR
jgi:hypothetical protein